MQQKIKVFVSYAYEDDDLRKQLDDHLSLLKRQNFIDVWHDRKISPGHDWKHEIDTQLSDARVILLLVSASFLASDYYYGVELKKALEKHKAGQACVIPIVLRPVDWKGASFSHLQALPTGAKPVTDRGWHNQDEAFADVAQGIRRAIEELHARSCSVLLSQHEDETKNETHEFDVFLCYNHLDKEEVEEIGRRLQKEKIKPWFDEWELQPGRPWQRALEEQIAHIKSAAVFIGAHGMRNWQWFEVEAFLREFVSRNCPVIPAFLKSTPPEPNIPHFLQGMTWVDFRKEGSDPFGRLIWGIQGIKPNRPNILPKPTNIRVTYQPSREGNKGMILFTLNGAEQALEYIRNDRITQQIILLKRKQEELVRLVVPFATLKPLEKRVEFQIDGVNCLFTFKMRAITSIMSIQLEVGGVEVFHQ